MLFDAVDMVSTQQLRQLPGRKAIIALTDGKDEGSKRTLQEAVRSTLAADAIFFGIDPKEKLGDRMDILKELSSQTGGSAFHIDNHTTLDAALRAIEEQLRNQYAIGYAPPDNSKKGTFHKVEVRVNKPGFTVRARSGYFR
jgi:Ca-activated chloride channel family protein